MAVANPHKVRAVLAAPEKIVCVANGWIEWAGKWPEKPLDLTTGGCLGNA